MLVIVGASASGKSTLQKALMESDSSFEKIVTYTTRPPRDGEVDGLDYHYITNEEFEKLLSDGFFVEHATYRGWHYGTSKQSCISDNNLIAVLTPSGLRALKRLGVELTSIYIHVDRRSLMINILNRGDDIDEAYRRNLSDVGQFDGIENEVDYVIDNSNFEMDINEVVQKVKDIIGGK